MTQSPFLIFIEDYMMVRNYSRRTINSYVYWIKYFIVFNGKQHPSQLHEVEHFLKHLAVNYQVALSTQAIAILEINSDPV